MTAKYRPFPSPSSLLLPLFPVPSVRFEVGPLNPARGLGAPRSEVLGRAQTEIEFGAF